MSKQRPWKNAAVGALVAAALICSIAVLATSVEADRPTLGFEGMEFVVKEDGSIQALISVYVENVGFASGTNFYLAYNPKYLSPSAVVDNAVLNKSGFAEEHGYFTAAEELYALNEAGEKEFLFELKPTDATSGYLGFGDYGGLDTTKAFLGMNLTVNTSLRADPNSTVVKNGKFGESEEEKLYIDAGDTNGKVKLGKISFRVNEAYLQEIVTKFAALIDSEDPSVGDDFLIKIYDSITPEPWQLTYWNENGMSANYTKGQGNARVLYNFQFPATLVKAEAAEREVAVNAWQAYTGGAVADVAAVLQAYSPMVTATYADGSVRNFLMHWGLADTADRTHGYGVYQYSESAPDHKGPAVTDYDCTGGTYLVEQYFYYEEQDIDGNTVTRRLPTPIRVKLTVSPVTVTGVTADRLEQTYILDGSFAKQYISLSDLNLPQEARVTTDVAPGGVSLTLPIEGWTPAPDKLTELVPEGGDGAKHWPAPDADFTNNLDNIISTGAGDYKFHPAGADGTQTAITAQIIRGAYPWLTVKDSYDLTAVRTLTGAEHTTGAAQYRAAYVSTSDKRDTSATLTLEVRRLGAAAEAVDMAAGAVFRVRLPGGTELVTTGGGSWFAQGWGSYQKQETNIPVAGGAVRGYQIVTNPGPLETAEDDAHLADRELLRRAINLGGWFQVAVNEKPGDANYLWSDFIPVYVPPRDNRYTESKEYYFTGINAGLFRYSTPLSTTLTMPRGAYVPVDPVTGALASDPVSYGVATTYDGQTGGQPGSLFTFSVDGPWGETTGAATTYGPNAFQDGAVYTGYGRVQNTSDPKRTATISVEEPAETPDRESLRLTYEGAATSSISTDAGGEVALAVYDTRQVDYTSRQEYVFTLTNDGTTPIYGLYIDTATDDDGDGGHYEVIKPPASYLPAGGKTTFTLTYVYGLAAVRKDNYYLDTLFICSDRRGAGDALKKFDARFQVSSDVVSRVTVVAVPEDGCMGTAGLVEGVKYDEHGDPAYTMDYTPHAATYVSKDAVYVSAALVDEYQVKEAYYTDRLGNKVALQTYPGGDGSAAAALAEGTAVFYLPEGEKGMPNHNITIYVVFYEPDSSKMRLGDLKVYAGAENDGEKLALQELWRKKFAKSEENSAEEAKMRLGTADERGFDASTAHYLTVIPFEAQYAQVEATLREVLYLLEQDGVPTNPGIQPEVTMYLYSSDGTPAVIYGPAPGLTNGTVPLPDGTVLTGPTTHKSAVFASPAPGESKYVQIEIGYTPPEGTRINRSYYVEIVRRTEDVFQTTGFGNAPYGMIMNAANIPAEDKQAAKDAFDLARRFAADHTPVKAAGLTNKYNTEAWTVPGTAYEPESGTDLDAYGRKPDLDRDDYALFVLLGQAFEDPGLTDVKDSSMRAVDPADIRRTVEIALLDTEKTAQAQRFQGPVGGGRTVTLDLGAMDGLTLNAGWEKGNAIRPGVYTLVYEFTDFDGTTLVQLTRPLVILGAVGDVTADGAVTAGEQPGTDERILEDRVTDPLGYAGADYPDAELFKYRTCDVNNDRNINNIDANQLGEHRDGIVPFYRPTDYK